MSSDKSWAFLFRVLDVLKARGYKTNQKHRKELEQIVNGENLYADLIIGDLIFNIRYYSSKFNKDDLIRLSDYVDDPNTTIFIIADVMTSTGSSSLNELIKSVRTNSQIEIWETSQLLINPLTHAYAPVYKILTEDERYEEIPILRRDPTFIKKMEGLMDDAAVKWLGGKVGDIVRIERVSEIMKAKMTDYRVVRKITHIKESRDK